MAKDCRYATTAILPHALLLLCHDYVVTRHFASDATGAEYLIEYVMEV